MNIIDKIKSGKILVSDGAWGTFLQQKGLKPGECPELWNIDHPIDVQAIAQDYIDAGSDMIETNSFGSSSVKLQNYGLADRTREINVAAAQISRNAAGKDKSVLGSIGPTGKILMMGDITEEELYNIFNEQAMALEKGGADAIIVETMSDLDEARIAVSAAKENTKCLIICTMTFEKTVTNEYRTMMGISPTDMIDVLINAGASIIGSNCGNGSKGMVEIVKEIRLHNKEIPIMVQANAGLPLLIDDRTVYPEKPDEMASFVNALIEAGANIIGGCCGTTPLHIKKISEIIKNRN
jgi:5-methyltetrahydrofolate--homocysteine methyltransferase